MSQTAQRIDFTGRCAVVTGAGAGVGREIATLLASRNAGVVVNDCDTHAANAAVAQIVAAGGRAVANHDRVGSSAAAASIVETAIDTFGRIDIVINNAGVDPRGALDDLADEEIERALRTLFQGPYALMRAAWPRMRSQEYGRILNVSSAAVFGIGGLATYAGGKAGLLGLTLAAAQEGLEHGILVNALLPTALTQMNRGGGDAYFRAHFRPEKVAPIAAYLVSEELTHNGLIVHTAGGLTARVAYVRFPGRLDPDPTIESTRDHFSEIVEVTNRVGSVVEGTKQHQRIVISEHGLGT